MVKRPAYKWLGICMVKSKTGGRVKENATPKCRAEMNLTCPMYGSMLVDLYICI